jgi:hypothetical protein
MANDVINYKLSSTSICPGWLFLSGLNLIKNLFAKIFMNTYFFLNFSFSFAFLLCILREFFSLAGLFLKL